ncbi:MAG: hypothetical protein GF344_14975 [Chitinivibrionales bacterium]|nr:hypothetical protein [Chitinivibrionales bacterium]MBD3358009.1 hypothetical protein [Chitinivibrionales bacterium]
MKHSYANKFCIIPVIISLVMAPVFHSLKANACACRVRQNSRFSSIGAASCCSSSCDSDDVGYFGQCCECRVETRGEEHGGEPFFNLRKSIDVGNEPRCPAVAVAVYDYYSARTFSRSWAAVRLPGIASHVSSTILRL